ncbi:hypothetical protein EXIGLDRAFT_293031 [Exidia glandulosa HHB12029]|uniref:Uncharacterized protein n=1 Tax=Exidia glandulosa HHB12029 TaxID=1314781 RepID=A0A165M1Z1_EXIGL|nr:hypothetical protein EXIGLDRAFT_293031 [Exidia glandulosa HHB12029]
MRWTLWPTGPTGVRGAERSCSLVRSGALRFGRSWLHAPTGTEPERPFSSRRAQKTGRPDGNTATRLLRRRVHSKTSRALPGDISYSSSAECRIWLAVVSFRPSSSSGPQQSSHSSTGRHPTGALGIGRRRALASTHRSGVIGHRRIHHEQADACIALLLQQGCVGKMRSQYRWTQRAVLVPPRPGLSFCTTVLRAGIIQKRSGLGLPRRPHSRRPAVSPRDQES